MKLLLLLSLYFKAARTTIVHSDVREEKVNCLASQKIKSRERRIIYEFSCKRNLHGWRKQSGIELKGSTREMKDSHNGVIQRETGLQKTVKSLQRNELGCK